MIQKIDLISQSDEWSEGESVVGTDFELEKLSEW